MNNIPTVTKGPTTPYDIEVADVAHFRGIQDRLEDMFDAMAPQGDTITLYANPATMTKFRRSIRVGMWRKRRRASEY